MLVDRGFHMLYACYRELMAVLVCFCCFQGTALVAGEAVETFSDLARFSVVQGGERRQSLQRDPTLERIYFQFAEEQKVPAMEILIPENKGRRRLPDIPVTLVLTVSHSTPEPFNNIALRISDRENETFHFLPVKNAVPIPWDIALQADSQASAPDVPKWDCQHPSRDIFRAVHLH